MNGTVAILQERLEKLTQRCEELCDTLDASNRMLNKTRAQLAEAQRDVEESEELSESRLRRCEAAEAARDAAMRDSKRLFDFSWFVLCKLV